METMQAVVKTAAQPGAAVVTRQTPRPGPGQVLIRVLAASICGTDHHVYAWDDWAAHRVRPPVTMGHECAGEVVELGSGAGGVQVGDLVSVETHVTCGVCYPCRTGQEHICEKVSILGVDQDGAFADYLVVPAKNAWVNAKGTDPALAAIQEPFGNAVHTALATPLIGRRVAVIGVGPIGLMATAIARAAGAEQVVAVDLSAYRLEMAQRMGADAVVDASREDSTEALRRLTKSRGLDVVLEMSGSERALDQALAACANGATVALLGLPPAPIRIDLGNRVIMKGITLLGITGRRMFETWYRGQALQASGRVDLAPLITHRLPLTEVAQAMDLLASGDAAKIVLIPGGV